MNELLDRNQTMDKAMFMRRDSGGNLIIASRHPKWSLTWSWILSWSIHKGGKFFFTSRTYKYRPGLYGQIRIGRLRFERQPTMRDGQRSARHRRDAQLRQDEGD